MIWLLLALAAIAASEAMLRLPLVRQARDVIAVSGKSMHVLGSKRISDHWKERVLPSYSLRMAKGSIGFFISLCLGILPVILIGFVAPGGLHAWLDGLLSLSAIGVLCVVSIAYVWIRLKVVRV